VKVADPTFVLVIEAYLISLALLLFYQDLLFPIFWPDLIVGEFDFEILLFSSSGIRVASDYTPPSWEAMQSHLSS
jgi:hypothetical protein